jgi:ribosomal protein S27AE
MENVSGEKRCRKCGETKPLDDFYAHPRMADGHLHMCKECAKLRARAFRDRRIEHWQEHDRERAKTPDGKARTGTAAKRWIARNQSKRSAHMAVGHALRNGTLQKPEACEMCGSTVVIDAHHDDYSKPLDVRWLCHKCHMAMHRKERRAA